MPRRTSLGHALVVAAAVHLGLWTLAAHVRAPHRPPAEQLVAVELQTEVVPPVPAELPPDPSEPRATSPTPDARLAVSTRPTRSAVGSPPSALVLRESEPAPADAWTLRVTTDRPSPTEGSRAQLEALGLGGRNQFMGRRETPEEEARAAHEQANAAAGGAMRQALHDRDVSLGLGGGGPVLSALEAAVREGPGADESRAVLVAVADASGLVLRVDVESSTDDPAFQIIAEDALKRLRGQRLRMPAGAQGLAMRVTIDSRLAAPSGGSAGLDARSLGAHFDIADLGAKPRRVVHARVLAEQVL